MKNYFNNGLLKSSNALSQIIILLFTFMDCSFDCYQSSIRFYKISAPVLSVILGEQGTCLGTAFLTQVFINRKPYLSPSRQQSLNCLRPVDSPGVDVNGKQRSCVKHTTNIGGLPSKRFTKMGFTGKRMKYRTTAYKEKNKRGRVPQKDAPA